MTAPSDSLFKNATESARKARLIWQLNKKISPLSPILPSLTKLFLMWCDIYRWKKHRLPTKDVTENCFTWSLLLISVMGWRIFKRSTSFSNFRKEKKKRKSIKLHPKQSCGHTYVLGCLTTCISSKHPLHTNTPIWIHKISILGKA